jgi:hypothetical protein
VLVDFESSDREEDPPREGGIVGDRGGLITVRVCPTSRRRQTAIACAR